LISDHHLFTIDELNDGMLIYKHDGTQFDGFLILDTIHYQIVQNIEEELVISDSQFLFLADPLLPDSDDDSNAVDEAPGQAVIAPLIEYDNFKSSLVDNKLKFEFTFDKELEFVAEEIQLYLVSDPLVWDTSDQIASFSPNDSEIFTFNGTQLIFEIQLLDDHILLDKEGYVFVDIVSQGNVLRSTDEGKLSLVGNPTFYRQYIDFKAPEIIDHTFINSSNGLIVQLNLSEPAVLEPDATIILEEIHEITGELNTITELPITTSGSPDLLLDLTSQLNRLDILPGKPYMINFGELYLTDERGNKSSVVSQHQFMVPFPTTDLF
jgi:hypothetical protein